MPAHLVSLTSALGWRAAQTPERTAYVFLAEGEEEQGRLTYAALDARAREIAAALSRSVGPGERALLLDPPGLDFVAAFFGCLYAGVIAVPAYPPRSPRMMPRLLAILGDAQPAVVLAAGAGLQRVRGWLERTPGTAAISWLATDELDPTPTGWEPGAPKSDAVAFLQYTSGSTSTPKGVMVTQANLTHNQRVIQEACGHSEESIFVSWLPPYHDLGLIGNLLQATWVGAPCVLMAPVAFLQKPSRWPRAVSRYRGTTSGGPNFAYDLCARRVPPAEIEQLDLSSWQVAFNGAEPVREETLARFASAFAPAGFEAGALYPCYGLAEATLMVSGRRPGEETVVREVDGRRLVGCGRVLSDLEVAVVDPGTGVPCPPGGVGEIWIAGDSVARGYWNRLEETALAFGAALADGRGARWLRSGDLGALVGGDLFVAGRLKDMIILRGRNHYPQDLEATATRTHPDLSDGTSAAFAIDAEGEERLVIVHQVERHAAGLDEIAAAIRQAIAEEHEALVYEVALVPPGVVPRTTSGKVQRRACRELYLRGELRVLVASRLSPAIAAEDPGMEALPGSLDWLRRAFAAAARVDPTQVDADRPLSASGLDSLAAMELKHTIEEATGVALSLPDLLEGMTLREVERRVAEGAATAERIRQDGGEARDASGEHPLSWNQRSLWFLHRLAPESPAYNLAVAARLDRGLETEALRRALQALIDRHATLRTLYAAGPDGPVQRVTERIDLALLREDASGWGDEELRRSLHEKAFQPFDLERGPIFRAALLERGEESFLVLAAHHIAADFRSFALLVRELGSLYAAGGDAQAAGLPALRVRYTNFVRRQEESLAGPRGEELQRWWHARLAGAPPLDLPSDRPRPAASSGRGTKGVARLSVGRLAGLRSMAVERGATLFMALLAGLQALLARHSAQEDFLVGAPTSGRESVVWMETVGYFVNPVALRADLAGDPTGEELLARIRRTALDAFERADFPIALLPGPLQPRAMLTLQKVTEPELAPLAVFALGEAGARLSLGGLTLESLALQNPAAQRELTLTAAETEGGLALSLQLDADLFDATTADRMLGHLGQVLDALTSELHRRFSALELLTGSERRQVLAAWSGSGLRFPTLPLHRLFAARAARSPGAVAVSFDGSSLTYAELDGRANRLARRLRRLGIGPEARVGLFTEPSLGLVEGLLAILKAGGAYVPLDPRLPAGRLAELVADSGVRVILAQKALPAPLSSAVTVVGLDEGEGESSAPCEDRAVAANAAYVIYTSGSTGRPKGVVVSHAEVARLLAATEPWFGFHAGDVWTLFHSFAFDFSVWEIWGAFAYGGRLVVVPYEVSRSPQAFDDLLAREGVTVLNQTPSAFRQLLAAEGRRTEPREPALRWVIFGGEALEPASLLPWFERQAPGAGPRLVNMYGITETTVHVTFCPMTAADATAAARPLGVPIPDLRVYLLDRQAALVPALVAGEIHIGGDGLARGYLNRPDLTAERFVPDPWSGRAGARLYRSGDLARWRPDGHLEYLGRIDDQVKIRGFRIEPREIQAALARHPQVRETVVLGRAAGEGETRLAAWVVPAVGTAPSAVELRRFLRERLPDYMVPADLTFLKSMPLTANGKVDRRALPAPTASRSDHDRASSPPADPVEEILAGIWADLLQVDRVGRDDDFFELGGDSLRATRVTARLRDALDVELPLASLFARPVLADLAEEVRRIRRAGGAPPAPRVAAAPRDGAIPLSFSQESLWFLDRLAPGMPVYNLPAAMRVRGPLDAAAFAASLTGIAERHEALRTVFSTVDGRPYQIVLPPAPVPLPLVETGAAEVWRLAAAEARRPFDLERGPLVRALLLRYAPEEHLLVLVLHHMVSDGWSVSLLLREIEALYADLPAQLPELPVQYVDYAVWQRRRQTDAVLAEQLSWWRERLADAPPALDLPTDRARRGVPSFRGSSHPVRLPAELAAAVHGLARRQGGTLFMALLAGFATLLHRYSGQDDLLIGAPFANRPRQELEPLIGYFVSSLPLRASFRGDPDAAELLARLRTETLGASEHRDLPLERLLQELQPRHDRAQSPLFQVMLALDDGALQPPVLPGCTAEIAPLGTGTAKLDLTLALAASGAELAGELEISSDLFEPATAERLIGHFTALLSGFVDDPRQPVSRLPLLAAAERGQILREWNDTRMEGLAEGCLHLDVAAQAARTPSAVAVEMGVERWTYRRLAGSARCLARHLRTLGVGPDVIVGLCAERSPALVVGMLAVLEAGGAWLPLDTTHPAERLAFMLDDSGARVLLIQEHLRELVPAAGLSLVPLDARWDSGEYMGEPLGVEVTADHLAYVIYTSGSTGRPKGVMVPHRGVCNRLRWAKQVYRLDESDAFLQKASFGFDVSVWECFAPLTAGARLVLAEPGREGEGPYLARVIREHRITLADFIPSMLAVFLAEEEVETCTSLRQIFVGGERLTPELRDRALARLPIPLDNMYGPTEASIDTTRQVCAPRQEPHRVLIGRPIGNSRLYVVDPELRPLPVGVIGELLIGGVGVTRGYWRRPVLTAERFVPDSLSGDRGARLYRTGDLARWTPAGELELLGRIDHQVKIRGFRIELGEIEAELSALAGVSQAVVVAREDPWPSDRSLQSPGDRWLVAYVVGEVTAEELRRLLRERLPEHMVPAFIMTLAALPLTPSGKVDRKALPTPERETSLTELARTPLEELLAGIWAEFLGRERVGVQESFFDLGGHSLLAARLTARLREAFGVELPLRTLFEAPSVAQLAKRLDSLMRQGRGLAAPLLKRASRALEPPLSFAQHSLWLIDRMDGGNAAYNMAAAVELAGRLDVSALAGSFRDVVERHEILRTRFGLRSGEPRQIIHSRIEVPLPLADLSALTLADRWEEAGRAGRRELRRPFDLERAPLLRTLLVRLAPDLHVLALCQHHAVSDAWSIGVLVGELMHCYTARVRHERPTLPALPIQYADWSHWQREWLRGDALERLLAFWRGQLGSAPPPTHLPTTRLAPAARTSRGGHLTVEIPPELEPALRTLARREGVTLFMLLLAVFKVLLHASTRQEDLVLVAAVAGRDRRETEGLIGCFFNMLPLRTSLADDPPFRWFLQRVRETCLDAFAHQDLPFERLVAELRLRNAEGRSPFQVAFGVQSAPPLPDLPGLAVQLLDWQPEVARLDLTLWVHERPQGLSAAWTYSADLFERGEVERLHASYAALLAAVIANPEARLRDLALAVRTDRESASTAHQRWEDLKRTKLRESQRRSVRG